MIQIMKASAGSGKTFNLARKYIELLLGKEDPYAYRHILAVTFTNKATDEMKNRILHELFCLADCPQDSDYLEYLVPALFGNTEDLRRAADEILCNLLHDYSAFSVSTIDRFFQQTLKAFSREIGQFSSYQVELDKDSLVKESVDRVLDALTEKDADKLHWLTVSALEQIEKGGRYNLESGLMDIAARLMSDEHREMVEKYGIDEEKSYSREHLSEVRAECSEIIRKFESDVRSAAERISDTVIGAGLTTDDFNRHFLSAVYSYVRTESVTAVSPPTASFMSKARDPEQWFAKTRRKNLEKVYPALSAPLDGFCDMFGEPYRIYRTAYIIRDQLYGLGLAGDINREFASLMKERNVLSIDDSNTILKDIIAGSDAPFVYEKTGIRYDSFLLDEFQDTSRIQWENFLPLLKESEGKGCDSLVVGDVKQSIYRWRGSDWNLLAGEIRQTFPGAEESTLDTNYRSCRNVVKFNNGFFSEMAVRLDRMYDSGLTSGSHTDIVEKIYADVVQKCASGEDGSVDLTFCTKDLTLQKVLDSIHEVTGNGASLKDIAVLVRNNASGASIAEFLISNGIRVITDDSLKVRSSVIVRRLVSLLSYVDNPSDSISGYLSSSLDVRIPEEYGTLTGLCETLLRELKRKDEEVFESEILYIQSFMDCVSDYAGLEGNSLRGFLAHWAEIDPAISSPDAGDSVRVMTIHKSKGLDFPYVIVPFIEKVVLFKADCHWCHPDPEVASLPAPCRGIYNVTLSSSSDYTLFSSDYREELMKQYIDNMNVLYVAFTRARKGMHLIGEMPSDKFVDSVSDGQWRDFSNFSQALYNYAEVCGECGFSRSTMEDGSVRFSIGEISHDWKRKDNDEGMVSQMGMSYPSWPVNPEGSAPRLLLSRSNSDFFADNGETGIMASGRLKGIVLHEILSRVTVPEDLEPAVRQSVLDGNLDTNQAEGALSFLSDRIAAARQRGWFSPEAMVFNEADVIDTDGSVYRPDRVEIYPERKVRIIDYKFGRRRQEYVLQVTRYADIFTKMGYSVVQAVVWYVMDDSVDEMSL